MTLPIALLILALALHLFEEVKTGFRENFPLGEMPLPIFIGINIAIYSFASVLLGLAATGHPAHKPLALFFAFAVTLNGLFHLGIMVIRRAYFPGGATALLLILAAGMVIIRFL